MWCATRGSSLPQAQCQSLARNTAPACALRQALLRYQNKITPAKRGAAAERYRLRSLLADPLVNTNATPRI